MLTGPEMRSIYVLEQQLEDALAEMKEDILKNRRRMVNTLLILWVAVALNLFSFVHNMGWLEGFL